MAIHTGEHNPVAHFSDLTQRWLKTAFDAPTAAQLGAWEAIQSGDNTLVVAPTGSGKTLAAFLSAIDTLATSPRVENKRQRCRVLYISPLKALASDVERNLRSPLVGLAREAERVGACAPEITIDIRTGDTPAADRRRQAATPPDILITTPESLFLMLTSQARDSLRNVHTVIVDEVHAVAGTKRGSHLAVSLERLDDLLAVPAQRIGLSATVEPIEEVALFLGGQRPVTIVNPPARKELEISIVVPVDDLASPGVSLARQSTLASRPSAVATPMDIGDPHEEILSGGAAPTPSIWPHVEERIVDLINSHTSTLVFVNSRRLAERLTARINEIATERLARAAGADGLSVEPTAADSARPPTTPPAQLMGQAGASAGAEYVIARAHHGSVSKEQRALIEDDLKAGRIPAVVATSSLELGIDMGAVDLVIQVEAPPTVASALQRVGRAGHQVGEISRAAIFPKHRGDLVACTVVADQMDKRRLEPTRVVRNPLDVLAQQIVAMVSINESIPVDAVYSTVRRSAPFANLPVSAFDAVLDMLAGKYPADSFAELRPRIVWDRTTNTLSSRPGAQRLAVTSGGTIPDRGLFGVFMIGEQASRVGELDEEMVYESRVGDVFALGATSWRIEEITHDRVLVSPAPGQPGRLPFWHGDALGRPYEIGVALGSLCRAIESGSERDTTRRLSDIGLDARAADNLLRYLDEQREATGHVAHDQKLVIERFRDELGDWRIVLHSPFGARVHAPWALAISSRITEITGFDANIMHADDGIILRIPDTDDDAVVQAAIDALLCDADDIGVAVTNALTGSALFASRFRECAARALLLPRRDPGRRSPLWQQRQRSASLLSVAAQYPEFPIILETMRECLQDVYDVPALEGVLRAIAERRIEVVTTSTAQPSPFARTLLFSYVATFLYEGDSPLAERRAAALTLDTELLAELTGSAQLRELLSAEAIADVAAEVGYLTPDRHPSNLEQVADVLRIVGPLTTADLTHRSVKQEWIDQLIDQRRAITVRIAGAEAVAAIEDAGRLRDALGTALPTGIPDAFLDVSPDPVADLVARYARTHGPFTIEDVAAHFGLGASVVAMALARLQQRGVVVCGEFSPGRSGDEWCDAQVLRRIRRRSIAALRKEVEAVPAAAYGQFLPEWNYVLTPRSGVDGVLTAVETLAGAALPASLLETQILPLRVRDYAPQMLDELMSAGEVQWCGRGRLPNNDGWISLAPTDIAPLLLPPNVMPVGSDGVDGPATVAVIDVLRRGGSWLFREIAQLCPDLTSRELTDTLWELLWDGHVTTDTLAPLRATVSSPSKSSTRSARSRGSAYPRTRASRLGRQGLDRTNVGARIFGRWSLREESSANPTQRATATAQVLLERYGIVTRGSVTNEGVVGGFSSMYRVLSALEDTGTTRRGYFVEGLGAAQFAIPEAVDRLRTVARDLSGSAIDISGAPAPTVVMAACDPANPFGGALPWPKSAGDLDIGHRPGRKVGAVVVIRGGELMLYVERGGKSILGFSADESELVSALTHLATSGTGVSGLSTGLRHATIQRFNGNSVLTGETTIMFERAGFVATPSGMKLR